jgi:hypothetical protein
LAKVTNSSFYLIEIDMLRSSILFILLINFHVASSQNLKRDSLLQIAQYYGAGYYLENKHDTIVLKKIEKYYLLIIKEDSTFKKAYIDLKSLYLDECNYYGMLRKTTSKKKKLRKYDKLIDYYVDKHNQIIKLYGILLKKEDIQTIYEENFEDQ